MTTEIKSFKNSPLVILSIFILVLLVAAVISELFQTSDRHLELSNLQDSPIKKEFLSEITAVHIKNRIGEFILSKDHENAEGKWNLSYPRFLLAKEEVIQNLIEQLGQLKVEKLFNLDPVNINNFSLDNPILEIGLINSHQVKTMIKLGLKNSIFNTSYISVEDTGLIYQVTGLNIPLETFSLIDFVESRAFIFSENDISKFFIYRGSKNSNSIHFQAEKENDQWLDSGKKNLDHELLTNYFKEFTTIKTNTILDQKDKEVEAIINTQLEKPLFEISVQTNKNQTISYTIANIYQIPGLKIDFKKYVLLKSSDVPHPFLVSRDLLKKFDTREWNLRELNVKKILQ
jgi:hypothetical protein